MGKKLTYEIVKAKFEEEGYTLVSGSYVDSKTKLECVCPEGHSWKVTWNDFQQGSRCFECNGTIKHTYEFIRDRFLSKGYTLISNEYINSLTKLDYTCSNGHTHSMNYNKFSLGVECPQCQNIIRYTYDDVKSSFEAKGYILLSKEYTNNSQKLDYLCSNGHEHSIAYSHFLDGVRCSYCVGNARLNYDQIKIEFEKEHYILLSTEYVNSKTKLTYKCSKGHTHAITWSDWSAGYRCVICHIERMSGPGNINWGGGLATGIYCGIWRDKEFKFDIRDRDGHKCLNPYCNSLSPEDLSIHHINYDKQDCNPKNLITVCRSCNTKANTDRDWHMAWYQAILKQRYNYKY